MTKEDIKKAVLEILGKCNNHDDPTDIYDCYLCGVIKKVQAL